MFRIAFKYLTDSYALLENPEDNCKVMMIVGAISYIISYKLVGILYEKNIIHGRDEGKVFHWSIRFLIFLLINYVVASLIRVYNLLNCIPIQIWVIGLSVSLGVVILTQVSKYFFYKRIEAESLNEANKKDK